MVKFLRVLIVLSVPVILSGCVTTPPGSPHWYKQAVAHGVKVCKFAPTMKMIIYVASFAYPGIPVAEAAIAVVDKICGGLSQAQALTGLSTVQAMPAADEDGKVVSEAPLPRQIYVSKRGKLYRVPVSGTFYGKR